MYVQWKFNLDTDFLNEVSTIENVHLKQVLLYSIAIYY